MAAHLSVSTAIVDPVTNILRHERWRQGISQSRMAELLGVNQSTVSEFESGAVSPYFKTVRAYANVLGLDLAVTLREPM